MASDKYDLDKLREILKEYKYDVLEYHGLGHLKGKMSHEEIVSELKKAEERFPHVLATITNEVRDVNNELTMRLFDLSILAEDIREKIEEQRAREGMVGETLKRKLEETLRKKREIEEKSAHVMGFLTHLRIARDRHPR